MTLTLNQKAHILGVLVAVRAGSLHPPSKSEGICRLITEYTGIGIWEFNYLFQSWPYYSGQLEYPVPGESITPEEAFMQTTDMWDVYSKYGRRRRYLMNHMINELKKEIFNESSVIKPSCTATSDEPVQDQADDEDAYRVSVNAF